MPRRFGSETYVEQRKAVMDQKHQSPGKKSEGVGPGDSDIGNAVAELHNQHPEKWNDLGPHH